MMLSNHLFFTTTCAEQTRRLFQSLTSGGKITTPLAVEPGGDREVAGAEYLHPVKAIQGVRLQIGTNRGHLDGWIGEKSIFGRPVSVDD